MKLVTEIVEWLQRHGTAGPILFWSANLIILGLIFGILMALAWGRGL